MKYLIVGLGNPDDEYKNTRHNIGYTVLDSLAKEYNAGFQDKRHAYKTEIKYKARTLILIKPTTYMNLSGKAVNYYLQQEKIELNNLLIIVDDIALPLGTIRLKHKGSSGGHNGLQNIEDILSTDTYSRLRIGIGSDYYKGQQINYVLGEWTKEEQNTLTPRIELAINVIKSFATIGIDKTMNLYNNK